MTKPLSLDEKSARQWARWKEKALLNGEFTQRTGEEFKFLYMAKQYRPLGAEEIGTVRGKSDKVHISWRDMLGVVDSEWERWSPLVSTRDPDKWYVVIPDELYRAYIAKYKPYGWWRLESDDFRQREHPINHISFRPKVKNTAWDRIHFASFQHPNGAWSISLPVEEPVWDNCESAIGESIVRSYDSSWYGGQPPE